MDLLARREHSFQELHAKLRNKFLNNFNNAFADNPRPEPTDVENFEVLIEQQLLLLKEENLQSDERFVESFINGRKASGKGPLRIRQELEQKKVCPDLISTYLDDISDEWENIALDVYQRKFGRHQSSNYQEKAKRLRFMQYRGFGYELLSRVVK